jgi:hypothetical protein
MERRKEERKAEYEKIKIEIVIITLIIPMFRKNFLPPTSEDKIYVSSYDLNHLRGCNVTVTDLLDMHTSFRENW